MTITDMAFNPATGLLDTTTYPTEPADETAARTQVQGRLNEIRDYLNDTLITEITEGAFNFAASATGTDAYAVTITNVAALTTGLEVFVQADVANTGAATCQVNALTAKAIRKNGTTVLEDGDIPANGIAHLKYDGTNFQLLNPVKTTGLSAHQAKTVTDADGAHGLKIESGTFTPTIIGSSTAGSNTYSTQAGFYVKTGNMVHCDIFVALSAKDAAMAGNVSVGGLPFTSKTSTNRYSSAATGTYKNIDLTAGYSQIGGAIQSAAVAITLYQAGDNVAHSNIAAAAFTNDSFVMCSVDYEAA